MTGIGSQYLLNMLDTDKNYRDGSKTYKVTLPKGIPEANFWSFTLYDNQTRSMLDTPQRYRRAGDLAEGISATKGLDDLPLPSWISLETSASAWKQGRRKV